MQFSKIVPALFVIALTAACGAAPDPGEAPAPAEATASDESPLIGIPIADAGISPLPLKKCVAGPYTTYAYGNRCPDYAAVAQGLCSLSSEFVGGAPLAHSCQPIPGSIPQQYSYSLTYQCFRPEPCR